MRDTTAGWVLINATPVVSRVRMFAVVPYDTGASPLFAGSLTGGVLRSTDDGVTWAEINDGLRNKAVLALAASESTLFVGGRSTGVWVRPVSELISAVRGDAEAKLSDLRIDGPYPNPVRAREQVVTLSYSLAAPARIHISLVDAHGREVLRVAERDREAGDHVITFETSTLATGVYFMRLQNDKAMCLGKVLVLR